MPFFRKISISIILSIFTLNTAHAAFNEFDALEYLYHAFFDDVPAASVWSIDGGYGAPQYPSPYVKYLYDNSVYIESGIYLHEPTFYRYTGGSTREPWSDIHIDACTVSSAYRKMPLKNPFDGESTHYVPVPYNQNIPVKTLTVNQNVPNKFWAKKHGGLTDYMSDSFYFWSFGDGMRKYNKKEDDNVVTHAYPFIGDYVLSSLVYTEEWSINLGFSSDLDGGFALSNYTLPSALSGEINMHGNIYLEGCDIAKIKVVPNNAPTAKFSAYSTSKRPRVSTFRFEAGESSDPDGNPLTYSWTSNGITKTGTGENILLTFFTDDVSTMEYTVTLTVTDGDKSDSTNRTIYVYPLCPNCNF